MFETMRSATFHLNLQVQLWVAHIVAQSSLIRTFAIARSAPASTTLDVLPYR
jgi:hypothetical protein